MQTSNARLYNVILNECEESPHRYQQLKIDSGQLTVVVPPADWIKFSPSVLLTQATSKMGSPNSLLFGV